MRPHRGSSERFAAQIETRKRSDSQDPEASASSERLKQEADDLEFPTKALTDIVDQYNRCIEQEGRLIGVEGVTNQTKATRTTHEQLVVMAEQLRKRFDFLERSITKSVAHDLLGKIAYQKRDEFLYPCVPIPWHKSHEEIEGIVALNISYFAFDLRSGQIFWAERQRQARGKPW